MIKDLPCMGLMGRSNEKAGEAPTRMSGTQGERHSNQEKNSPGA